MKKLLLPALLAIALTANAAETVIRIYMPIAAIQGQRVIPKNITG